MKNVDMRKRDACVGCRNDRYNQPEGFCERPGIDAPVAGTGCWNRHMIKRDRKTGRYSCPMNSYQLYHGGH